MEINYTRCKECSHVYDATLIECPNCGAENTVNEDFINEAVFNILD